MSARDLISGEAELDDDSADESFDEETGEVRRKVNGVKGTNGHLTDSSEEEDDDDEEAEREVREGFIVDEDEDDPEARERRRQERKKRRREEREEEEAGLDEEDLDLIGESMPGYERRDKQESKYKRLKRGHRDDHDARPRGVDDIFDDEDEDDRIPDRARRRDDDEMAGFIEEDYEDERGEGEDEDDIAVSRRPARNIIGVKDVAGLDDLALEDMKEVFGDGLEYDWALEAQEAADLREAAGNLDLDDPDGIEKGIELKDVFEPSQLADRMLTEEDNVIRQTDVPERFQLARKPYKDLVMTESESREEAKWIANSMLNIKPLDQHLREPFQKAVAKVLEFMNTDLCEVPFIFQHRKDYLIHAEKIATSPGPDSRDADEPAHFIINAEKLLNQTDLWNIFDNDLKFRALIEKRRALQSIYENLQSLDETFHDSIIEETLPEATSIEELQDIQDYLHFQYSALLADLAASDGTQVNGHTQRRPGASKVIFDRIRSSRVYRLVQAFGLSADDFARNVSKKDSRRKYTEDPAERPDDMADSDAILDPPDYSSGAQCMRAAKAMYAEELFMAPRLRKWMRQTFFVNAIIDCHRTEKGLKRIDDQHPFYEFKYLRNQQLADFAPDPARFLRMLKAEEEGLVQVRVRLANKANFVKSLYQELESDNSSEIADAWNRERREALDLALVKLEKVMAKSLKEGVRSQCETEVAKICREEYIRKLDQAPWKPKGVQLGAVPRILTMSNGGGIVGRDAICWAWVNDDGRVFENGKFTDLSLGDPTRGTEDGADVKSLLDLIQRRNPDVIGVSGFSAEAKKLQKQLEDIVENKDLRCVEFEDDDGNAVSDKLDVIVVNDEIARLYQHSERAKMEHPGFAPLTKYCVGLAKYVQSPLLEYASLGRDIVSISFDPNQRYISEEKLLKALESAMVDIVNLCGVEINEAVADPAVANLLPYVCGLGPRKASQLIKVINLNGGVVKTRVELVGNPEKNIIAAVEPNVWNNCASFLQIEYESSDDDMNFLDGTRVHPEDYELGSKMASDALELDEEDVEAEKKEYGEEAVVKKLIRDEAQDKVNDLVLEEYAEQLEKNFNQRKRATLETIRAELQSPYEELRRNFALLSTDEIFQMFTGETRDSLCDGMIVPVSVRKVADDYVEVRTDSGIDGTVPASQMDQMAASAKQMFSMHQTVQAKVMWLHRKAITANFSLRTEDIQRPYKKEHEHTPDQWDSNEERKDTDAMKEKNDVSGRTQRVIKHPLFRPFNATQAEEYLGSQSRGDLVIRPSSKGLDHLAVTWKVSDNIYQHIDVLELGKSNDLTQGTTLRVGGRYTYSDLDELIVNHVKAMAKKIDEMTAHEKYQNLSRPEVERWLTTYTEANPKRSVYNFCIDAKHPGYFNLCFKAGQHASVQHWSVKVVPHAFELQKNMYPDMRALCNGFKLVFQNMQGTRRR